MHLNTIQPGVGSRRPRTRVGRGIGSGLGKTCGRGHKGQRAANRPSLGAAAFVSQLKHQPR